MAVAPTIPHGKKSRKRSDDKMVIDLATKYALGFEFAVIGFEQKPAELLAYAGMIAAARASYHMHRSCQDHSCTTCDAAARAGAHRLVDLMMDHVNLQLNEPEGSA